MNPIVHRELFGLLRSTGATVALLVCALATATLVLTHWPVGGVADLDGTAALGLIRGLGYGLLSCLMLVLPAFPATALVRERVRGTLALLLNTPLTPRAIYLGKLGGILGLTVILLLLTLPGASAGYALGGSTVSGGVGLLYLVLGMSALQIISVGLYVSARAQSIDGSLRLTYALVFGSMVLPLLIHWLVPRDSRELSELANWAGCISPVLATMEVIGHGGVGMMGVQYPAGAFERYAILACLECIVLGLLTVRCLSRNPLDRARPAGVMTQDRSSGAQIARRFFFLLDPNRRTTATSRLINPVLLKELRTRRFGRVHWIARLMMGTAMVSLGISVAATTGALGWGVGIMGGAMVLLQAVLLLLFAPSLSAGLISAERESGAWQLLRTTPLSTLSILFGKLLSAIGPVVLLLSATLPGYVVLMTILPETSGQVWRVLICQSAMAGFAAILGATLSSLFRTTAVATAVCYGVLATICILPLLIWLGRDGPFGHETVYMALAIDPIAAALSAADTPGFASYELLPVNWWIMGITSMVLFAVLVIRTRRLYQPD